jgi:hypothetical protein
MTLGDEAADRLGRVAQYISKEGAKLDARSEALERAAGNVQRDMGVLLADLPKAEERARQITDTMKEAGLAAHSQAGALEASWRRSRRGAGRWMKWSAERRSGLAPI